MAIRKEAALLIATIAGAWAACAGSAHAGTYDVVACNAPGAELRNRSWTFEPYNALGLPAPGAASFRIFGGPDTCHPGFGLALRSADDPRTVRVGDGGAWTFRAPAGTTVKRMQLWRHFATRASGANAWWTAYARAGDGVAGRIVFGGETCAGNAPNGPDVVWCRKGEPNFSPATLIAYDVGEPVVSVALECAGTTRDALCTTSADEAHAWMRLQAAIMTIDDPVPPALTAALPATGHVRQSVPVALAASDAAGVRAVRALVDGAERVAERYACDFRLAAPCPAGVTSTLDLAGLPDGPHALALLAEDAAGNVTRVERTVEFDGTAPAVDGVVVSGRRITARVSDARSGVAGGAIEVRTRGAAAFVTLKTTLLDGRLVATVPRSISMAGLGIRVAAVDHAGNTGSAAVTALRLSTRIGSRSARELRGDRVAVPYRSRVTVAGRLTTRDGAPLAGRPIELTGKLRRTGAATRRVAAAVTNRDGRFTVRLPPGPSRELTVRFAGGAGALHVSRSVALRVPATSTIHASRTVLRGAGRVRFTGRVGSLGTSLPPGGKIVELQGKENGRWKVAGTGTAKRAGGAWSISADFSGRPGRYPIRLRIRREETAFPYDLGYSRSIVIHVR